MDFTLYELTDALVSFQAAVNAGGKRRYLVADLDAHNNKYRQGVVQ